MSPTGRPEGEYRSAQREGAPISSNPVPPRRLWWLGAGFTVWCSALVVLYALHAIGCAFGWSTGPLRMGLTVVLLVHLIALGWMWRNHATARPESDHDGAFLRDVVIWTLIAALAASVIAFGPSLLLVTCI